MRVLAFILSIGLAGFSAQGAGAQSMPARPSQSAVEMAPVKVRYIVDDVDAAVAFYTRYLGFHLGAQSGRNFAMLSRGALQLVLSPPKGPGGASQAMPDGRRPEPGGWNRIILESKDLESDVSTLRKAGVQFRNNIVAGPGGKEILLDDPSHNPIELFQPTDQ